jgi:DNA polymerase-3 subunit alpha
LIVNELIPLDEIDQRCASSIKLHVDESQHPADILARLHEVTRGYPGEIPVSLILALTDGRRVTVTSTRTRIALTPELRTRLEELLGSGNVRLTITPPTASPASPQSRRLARVPR